MAGFMKKRSQVSEVVQTSEVNNNSNFPQVEDTTKTSTLVFSKKPISPYSEGTVTLKEVIKSRKRTFEEVYLQGNVTITISSQEFDKLIDTQLVTTVELKTVKGGDRLPRTIQIKDITFVENI